MISKMIPNKMFYVSILAVGLGILVFDSQADAKSELRIYLPKEKTLSTDVITLGQVAMLLGDQTLIEQANAVTLGQFTLPGQEIQVDRETVLSRLSSEGIKASVAFNGAEKISLRREGNCIRADQFVAAAESCLKKAMEGKNLHALELVRSPDNYLLAGDNQDITLLAHLDGNQSGKNRRVSILVMRNDVQLYRQDVVFSVQYQCQRLVAARDLLPEEVITSENVKLEPYISNLSIEPNSQLYGSMVRRALEAGTVITPSMVEPPKPRLIVKRRQKVLLKLECGGLFVSAMGEAMSDGSAGDLIEVRRGKGKDQRAIIGKVLPDGSIEPVL